MNITLAIRQMRVARRLGKLSLDRQQRIMRRARGQRPSEIAGGKNMGFFRLIMSEVQPILASQHQAEDNMSLPPSKRAYA